jgi:hypothetical protein
MFYLLTPKAPNNGHGCSNTVELAHCMFLVLAAYRGRLAYLLLSLLVCI